TRSSQPHLPHRMCELRVRGTRHGDTPPPLWHRSGLRPMQLENVMSKELPPIRRVVTGHDNNNVAKVIMDGPATNAKAGASGATSTLIWSTDSNPADCSIGEHVEDLGARIIGTPPPENGSRLPVRTLPPRDPRRPPRPPTLAHAVGMAGAVEHGQGHTTPRPHDR